MSNYQLGSQAFLYATPPCLVFFPHCFLLYIMPPFLLTLILLSRQSVSARQWPPAMPSDGLPCTVGLFSLQCMQKLVWSLEKAWDYRESHEVGMAHQKKTQ